MSKQSRSRPSHFFTLRLWKEDADAAQPLWRGRLQNLSSGEVRYFQDWDALVARLLELIEEEA